MTEHEHEHEPEPEVERENDEPVEPAVEPEPEPEAEPEPDAEPEPEADDRPSSNAMLAALERENTRHEKAFAKALDVKVSDLNLCPVCEGTGFTPEPIEAQPDIVAASGVMECPTCKGYGQMIYPTRVAGQRFQVCTDCAGMGWKREAPHVEQTPELAAAGVGNGIPGVPVGHILVKVDPNAPDAPGARPTALAGASAYAP